jgi:hypothetical protein
MIPGDQARSWTALSSISDQSRNPGGTSGPLAGFVVVVGVPAASFREGRVAGQGQGAGRRAQPVFDAAEVGAVVGRPHGQLLQ